MSCAFHEIHVMFVITISMNVSPQFKIFQHPSNWSLGDLLKEFKEIASKVLDSAYAFPMYCFVVV